MEPASEDAPDVSPPDTASVDAAGAPAAKPEYLPASELSEKPEPLHDVLVPYPEGAPPSLPRVVVGITLLLNESGRVDEIQIDEAPASAQVFVDAARASFLHAQFTPGKLDGVAVKSRLRLAVEFDAAPLDELLPPR